MPRPDETGFLPGFDTLTEYHTDFSLIGKDCLEGLPELDAESVDLVVTSPPYNLGVDYGTYQDDLPEDRYLEWTREWATEVKRVLKPDGALFLNIGATPASPWIPHLVILALRDVFALQNTIHWIKSITVDAPETDEPLSVGHFKPINSKRFLNDCHEYVFHLTKSGEVPIDRLALGVPYADKSNIKRWKHTRGRDKRCRGNTWFVPYETIKSRSSDRPHPATFPVKLAEYCIRLHGRPPEEVTMLDPFLGIGHAALAAARADVDQFVGFEIDPEFLETACRRLGTQAKS